MPVGKLLLTSLMLVIAACAGREVLLSKSPVVPSGIDLSGSWKLRNDPAADQRRINSAIRRTDGADDRIVLTPPDRQDSRARPTPNRGGLVHVFLQNGENLKITQTAAGIFISFDRAVVVEYRFGESREIRIGPVIADRVSGWEGETYVAETLDQNNMKLTERFALAGGGQVLRRTITLRGKNMQDETIFQVFDRVD
jgi:hypothetical protein